VKLQVILIGSDIDQSSPSVVMKMLLRIEGAVVDV
jgi:hypothetical protein